MCLLEFPSLPRFLSGQINLGRTRRHMSFWPARLKNLLRNKIQNPWKPLISESLRIKNTEMRQCVQGVLKKLEFWLFFRPEMFSKNDPYRGNFMWGIDSNHSRSLKMLPRSWFRKVFVYIKAKNINVHIYFPESGSGKHVQASHRFSA